MTSRYVVSGYIHDTLALFYIGAEEPESEGAASFRPLGFGAACQKKQEPEPHLYRLLEDKKHKEIVHLLVCLSVRPSVCPFQMGQHLWKTIFKKVHFWVKIFGTSIPGIPGQIRKNCSRVLFGL